MDSKQPFDESSDRRQLVRVKTDLRINYQIIARSDALKDPYATNFTIPRYYLMEAQLNELDQVFEITKQGFDASQQRIIDLIQIMDQKIKAISNAFYDTVVESFLPSPTRVDISENGLSFYALEKLKPGSHLHLSLSQAETDFHLCVSVRIVYSDETSEGFKTGAYFISLHPRDREKLARVIDQLQQRDEPMHASL